MGDSLIYHNGSQFTTIDQNNDDDYQPNCAAQYLGPWWHDGCHRSHLMGNYYNKGSSPLGRGLNWVAFKGHYYSMKKVNMMVYMTE